MGLFARALTLAVALIHMMFGIVCRKRLIEFLAGSVHPGILGDAVASVKGRRCQDPH